MVPTRLPDTMRVLRDVVYEAGKEARRIVRAKFECVLLFAGFFLVLGFDYKAAHVMFSYLDPTLGDVSMGPAILALSVPVAVAAIHLLTDDKDGEAIEARLHRLAGFGVFVFLFGIAAMVSLVFLDSTDGIGSQSTGGIEGTIGGQEIGAGDGQTSWLFSMFRGVFSGVLPMVFFSGMTLILFVSVYVCHRLMLKIEERYAFFSGATRRSKELKELFAEAEAFEIDIRKEEARLESAKAKLPGDPEQQFSRMASAAIGKALHRMTKALRSLDESDGVMAGVFARKAEIPPHIESRAEGRQIIADIRHQTTPYAILKELDGFPPKEED